MPRFQLDTHYVGNLLVNAVLVQHGVQVAVQAQLVQRALHVLAEAVGQPALLVARRARARVPAAAARDRLARAPRTLQLDQQFVHVP